MSCLSWFKTESHHAKFVVTGDTGGCRYDNLRVARDDIVDIMIAASLVFLCRVLQRMQ